MERLDGTDLIGRVIIYIGSLSAHHRERCVVVGYDEEWDRYTIEPLTGTCSRRIQRARRASLVQTKETRPVCDCGHAIQPGTGVRCLRCPCTAHTAPHAEVVDDELFTRVATGREHIIRDDHGTPVAVVIPYADYLIQRADAAFDRP